jgi:hypothetical protein
MLSKDYSKCPGNDRVLFQMLKPTGMVKGWVVCGDFDSDTPKIQFADSEKRFAKADEFTSFISLMD